MNAYYLRRVVKDPKIRRRETKKSNSLAVIVFEDWDGDQEVLDESMNIFLFFNIFSELPKSVLQF
jgi:hypothetical protein